jgi:hypothetical protein
MALFELTTDDIREIPKTTFAEVKIREREDLQRLFRTRIDLLAPEVLVISEEFNSWDASLRRIDLLGLDRQCRLVVIELKRNDDGAHMELQAVRYAAMISSMTFEQAIAEYRRYLDKIGQTGVDARESILDFLGLEEPPQLSQEVRIVLASADFSKEITTTVLWLNSMGMDVRCVRMRPHHSAEGKVLLDIQQVIPLPEAAAYQIAVQQKTAEVQAARGKQQSKDFTKYDLAVGSEQFERLSKRDFAFYAFREAVRRGFTPEQIHRAMPWKTTSLLIGFDGELDADALETALLEAEREPPRYYCAQDELFHVGGRTYALTKMWGNNVSQIVDALIAMMGPPVTIRYTPVPQG